MDKETLIPELRFGEFDGDWKKTNIKSIANKITDGTHDTPKKVNEGMPFITAIHVKDGLIDFQNCYYLPESIHNKIYQRCNPEKGDLLIVNIGSGTATTAQVNVDFQFSLKNVALIKPDPSKINSNLFEQIQREKASKLKHQLSSGGAQPFFSLKQIGRLKLIIPFDLKEQQKIANFLTAIDQRITKLKQKKASLEQYKKGLMQKIFNQEIRFRDDEGNDFVDWKEKKLGGVATFLKGKGLSKSDISENGKNKGIRYGELYTEYTEVIDVVKSETNLELKKCVLSEQNDVIIPSSGETKLDIATASCVLREGIILGGDLNIIRSKINGVFLAYYLNNFKKQDIAKLSQGISVVHLYSAHLSQLKLEIPCSEEQQKIANFLSATDKKITTMDKQITETESFKKGLLQQMFV